MYISYLYSLYIYFIIYIYTYGVHRVLYIPGGAGFLPSTECIGGNGFFQFCGFVWASHAIVSFQSKWCSRSAHSSQSLLMSHACKMQRKLGLSQNQGYHQPNQDFDLHNGVLVVEPTPLKNMIVKLGSSSPIFGVKINNILSCHHLEKVVFCSSTPGKPPPPHSPTWRGGIPDLSAHESTSWVVLTILCWKVGGGNNLGNEHMKKRGLFSVFQGITPIFGGELS